MTTSATPRAGGARRRNPLVRLLSNIWFGMTLLFLILLYASVFSALPQVRGAVEMTEMQVFQHWVFTVLVGLLCVSLAVVTWVRIRWNLVNAGVLMVHSGLLLLAIGGFWYFGTKTEGDVLLESPRVELRGPDGQPLPGAAVLPEVGRTWSGRMPAFGGVVRMRVTGVVGGREGPVRAADVAIRMGDAAEKVVHLDVQNSPVVPVDRLQVALRVFPPADRFYDDTTTALYYRKAGESRERFRCARIEGLPIFRERYLGTETLYDNDGNPFPSRRTAPEVAIGGVKIPTGWFEPWHLPIRIDAPDLPFDVEITGYVPYIAGTRDVVRPGGETENPAIELHLAAGGEEVTQWLLAQSPARSLLGTVEFRWVRSDEELAGLLRPLAGPHELTIDLRDPPMHKTVAIRAGQTIELEGTAYKLKVARLAPSWPLMTPGFEGARSPMASIDVETGTKKYNRTVIQRFPQLSQDIDEHGKRHREGPYDANLTLHYRTAAQGWNLIAAGPGIAPVLAAFSPDGNVKTRKLEVGRPETIKFGSMDVTMTVRSMVSNGRLVSEPVLEPLETRRPSVPAHSRSAIRLRLRGRGDRAGWSDERWILFSSYPDVDARAIHVHVPGEKGAWELVYSRQQHPLGGELVSGKLSVRLFPGRRVVQSWRSDFFARAGGAGRLEPAAVYTNQTYALGPWSLFQSGAAPDNWSYTILGVGNRNGIWPMTLGCVLITVGCLYAFYVKPVLKRRRAAKHKREPRGEAACDRGSVATSAAPASPELVEVE